MSRFMKNLGMILLSTIVIAIGYILVTAFFALLDITLGFISYGQQRDLVMAGSVIVIPYVIGGIFLGSRSAINLKLILFSGLTAAIGERTLILTLAYITLLGFRRVQPDGTVFYFEGAANLLTAIQTEAIGYFGWAYLFWGIPLSIAILWITTYVVQQRNGKAA